MSSLGDYAKNKIKMSRFFWHFWRWYSISGKSKIRRLFRLKNKQKIIIGISLTNICNAKCVFCVNSKISLKPKIMNYSIFKKSVDQIISLGENEIMMTPTVGDVLMDKDIARKIAYAKSKGLNISLITNGILLKTKNNYKKIVDAGVNNLMLSVGDVDESLDSKIYGITVEASKMRWKGISELLEYAMKNRSELKVHVSFRSMRPPYQIIKSKLFRDLTHFNNVSFGFLFCYDNWCGKITQNDLLGIMHLMKGGKKKGVCNGLYGVMIMPDGKVRLCGCRIKDKEEDELTIGDISLSSLSRILRGDKVKKLRADFANGIYPDVCKDCTFYKDSEKILFTNKSAILKGKDA